MRKRRNRRRIVARIKNTILCLITAFAFYLFLIAMAAMVESNLQASGVALASATWLILFSLANKEDDYE